MKIFVVTLMLFVVKGIEARALPGESNVTQTRGAADPIFVASISRIMKMHNLTSIFEHLAENMTSLTKEFRQKMETLGINVEQQAGTVKDRLANLFEQLQGTSEGISEQNRMSITQQFEMLKKDMTKLDLNSMPVNYNQTLEKIQQDLKQQMEQLQQVFVPLVNLFQGPIMEGIVNLRKSVSPGVDEISVPDPQK
ncbi:apolipoprotein A-IV-like [Heterodontus francisci]|uniref:apolipoprotein A-IV-like n=1 Tax=Heterodontus francisci TaxID=7792 RepID=UPI00355B100D